MSTDDKTRIVPDGGVRQGVQLNGIYEIDGYIATGGMGEVYRGHNIQTGDPVAIKIVLREFARDQNILALFRKEASILNHLSHDAIVRYHVFTIDPAIGRPYLAMEFVDGQSLGERIRSGPLDPHDARRMLARVASGLSLAHEAGVIHRDISPDNIVLPGGKVDKTKIIDFGIARTTGVGGGTLLGGSFAGKYNFVSPEQLGLFGGEVTEQSDIYSLGLVMAAALRGAPLNMGGSQVDVIEKRRVLPNIDGIDLGLLPLIESMLQPDPRDRPGSAAEIVEWLRTTAVRSAEPLARATQSGATGAVAPVASQAAVKAQLPSFHDQHSNRAPESPFADLPSPGRSSALSGNRRSVPDSVNAGAHLAGNAARPTRDRGQSGAGGPSLWRAGMVAAAVLITLSAAAGATYYSGMLDSVLTAANPTSDNPTTLSADEIASEGSKPPTDTVKPEQPARMEDTRPAQSSSEGSEMIALDGTSKGAPEAADWFSSFDGGPCFYATRTSTEPLAIEGLGLSNAPFDKLLQAYSAKNGSAPKVDARIIERDQCAVAEFLKAMQPLASRRLSLELNKNDLKIGDSLQGKLGKSGEDDINLLLIGKDGVVYNLVELLKNTGGEATFSMKLFPLTDEEVKRPEPHLIVAISSSAGIRSADIKSPELASDLFPKIRKEMETLGDDAGVAVGYFLFGG